MKKLIIVTILVVVLVIGAFGSTVMAAQPDDIAAPWARILQKVGDLGAKAEQIYQKVLDNAAALADVQENTARIASDQGRVNLLTADEDAGEVTFYETPVYLEGAHFNVTIWITDQDDISDHVKIHHAHWSQDGSSVIASAFQASGEDFYTYEFDAGQCKLAYLYHDNNDFELAWAVTINYASSP